MYGDEVKAAFVIGTKSRIGEDIGSSMSVSISDLLLIMQITVHIYKTTDPHPPVGRGQLSSAVRCSDIFFFLYLCLRIFKFLIPMKQILLIETVNGLVYLASVLS